MNTQEKINKLENDLNELIVKVENAKQMSNDLCEYFQINLKTNSNGQTLVLHEYNSRRIYSNILSDYINEIEYIAGNLSVLVELLGQDEVQGK